MQKVKDLKYERIDLDAVCDRIEKATASVGAAAGADEIIAVRKELKAYTDNVFTQVSLAAIRHTLDVNDEYYAGEQNYYDENMPKVSAKLADFDRAIVGSKYAGEVEKLINPLIMKNMRASVKIMDECIVEDGVEENKLITEYAKLMADLQFHWEGKTLTIGEMQGLTKDSDREVRRRAFAVIGETLASVSDKLDGIFDAMVKVRTRMAKKLGFDNFVEMGDLRIGHIGYGRKEIAVFRESVLKDVVPAMAGLKAALSKRLGIDGIHIYDNSVYIKGGNIDPIGDSAALFKAAQTMYDAMGERLGAFFREMCEAEAFDTTPREGKTPGGYAEMLFSFGQPFIFANFNGTMDDVGVLTHEFGHAFAFKRAYENKIDTDLFCGSMETAETHSMSMEALCNDHNAVFYGDRAREAMYQQIFDAIDFLPYGVIVDYFQERVYSQPDMTPAERKALWLELEREFRPYVDMSDTPYINIGGRWQYQRHIYEAPFYYIDYCLSTCLALQFGEIAAVDFDDALSRYLGLVEAGGTKTIDVLAHEAGLMSPFDRGALKKLAADVAAHLGRLEKA